MKKIERRMLRRDEVPEVIGDTLFDFNMLPDPYVVMQEHGVPMEIYHLSDVLVVMMKLARDRLHRKNSETYIVPLRPVEDILG